MLAVITKGRIFMPPLLEVIINLFWAVLRAWEIQKQSGDRWIGIKWPGDLNSAAAALLDLAIDQDESVPIETVVDAKDAFNQLTEAVETAVFRISAQLDNEAIPHIEITFQRDDKEAVQLGGD